MKERPILFSGPMVRAILDGRKTQTRRVVKGREDAASIRTSGHGWFFEEPGDHGKEGVFLRQSPYGVPGDRLWVREMFSGPWELRTMPPALWLGHMPPIWFWADGDPTWGDWTRPKPSIHMPRWASRITLEIIGVRVERLNECSEADALAEGIERIRYPERGDWGWPQAKYRELWESINGPGSWDANPWVWVVEFKHLAAAQAAAA